MKDRGDVGEAISQANEVFAGLGRSVEASLEGKPEELDVLEIAKQAGLEDLDEVALRELQIPRRIFVHPWLRWQDYYPWRPLWCWWWRRYYPWYGSCCPYWWYRCNWW